MYRGMQGFKIQAIPVSGGDRPRPITVYAMTYPIAERQVRERLQREGYTTTDYTYQLIRNWDLRRR